MSGPGKYIKCPECRKETERDFLRRKLLRALHNKYFLCATANEGRHKSVATTS
jgi:hypothetical protein